MRRLMWCVPAVGLLLAGVAVTVFLATRAPAQPPGGPPPGRGGPGDPAGLDRALDNLKLSDQERAKAERVLRAHHDKVRKFMDEARAELLAEMRQALPPEQFKQFREEAERRPGRGPAGVPTDDLVERVMRFDKNKDGLVTREELPERMHYLIEQGDLNKDGALDREELKKLAAKLAAEGPADPPPPPPPPPDGPPPPRFELGRVLPPFARDELNLTKSQEEEIARLEKDVKARLSKILTDEQKKRLENLRPPRPRGDRPDGPGRPPERERPD
jgi:Spy/CpxP family protein refolding chaperone